MSGAKAQVAIGEVQVRSAAHGVLALGPLSFLARLFLPVINLLRSIKIQRRARSMRICETLPLGEKRFLAIVQIEQQRFLIAATNQSISLLHYLEGSSQPHQHHPPASSDGLLGEVS
jgi:flagellar biogenesis protein FliO